MEVPKYDASFKNPCWWTKTRQLRCLPYFMLIGIDKSGTTDLFDRLAAHPDVHGNTGGMKKETMWWSWLRYGHWLKRSAVKQNFQQYLNYFSNASRLINATSNPDGFHYQITGDGTPMDFWDNSGWPSIPQNRGLKEPRYLTPHLIHHLTPDVKLLLVLRDPVERLFSDYFFLGLGNQTVEGFHRSVIQSVKLLHTCTRRQTLRTCLYDRKLHLEITARIHLGFYSVFLKDWLSVFPRNQILILRTEDYADNPGETMTSVLKHLELRTLSEERMKLILEKQRKHVTKKKHRLEMKVETRAILTNLYRSFNLKLAQLLEDERFLWS